MNERFSRGYYSTVYTLSDQERIRFPHAQLKKDSDRDPYISNPYWYALCFYRHKIASLLFPDNFIAVIGTTKEVTTSNVAIFSQIAAVPPEHAVYSAHMRYVEIALNKHPYGLSINKRSLCQCETCISHRNFHNQQNIASKARSLAKKISQSGILTPYDDRSDYCLNDQGKVVFFEIAGFEPTKLINYLDSLKNPSQNQLRAPVLLKRYQQLILDNWRTIRERTKLETGEEF